MTLAETPDHADAVTRLNIVDRAFAEAPALLFFGMLPVAAVGLLSRALAGYLLGDLATPEEIEQVVRALPHNPTTEMDLDLWALATRLRADEPAAEALATRTAADLTATYKAGALPPALQAGLAGVLARW